MADKGQHQKGGDHLFPAWQNVPGAAVHADSLLYPRNRGKINRGGPPCILRPRFPGPRWTEGGAPASLARRRERPRPARSRLPRHRMSTGDASCRSRLRSPAALDRIGGMGLDGGMDEREADDRWMALALAEAVSARNEDEVPVGAVVVLGDRLLGRPTTGLGPCAIPRPTREIACPAARRPRPRHYRSPARPSTFTRSPASCRGRARPCSITRVERPSYGAADPKGRGRGFSLYLWSLEDDALNHPGCAWTGGCGGPLRGNWGLFSETTRFAIRESRPSRCPDARDTESGRNGIDSKFDFGGHKLPRGFESSFSGISLAGRAGAKHSEEMLRGRKGTTGNRVYAHKGVPAGSNPPLLRHAAKGEGPASCPAAPTEHAPDRKRLKAGSRATEGCEPRQ